MGAEPLVTVSNRLHFDRQCLKGLADECPRITRRRTWRQEAQEAARLRLIVDTVKEQVRLDSGAGQGRRRRSRRVRVTVAVHR
jgi:hypothetical protein